MSVHESASKGVGEFGDVGSSLWTTEVAWRGEGLASPLHGELLLGLVVAIISDRILRKHSIRVLDAEVRSVLVAERAADLAEELFLVLQELLHEPGVGVDHRADTF